MTVTSRFETIKADPSCLRKTSWREYAVRFAFGGLVTALAGFLGTTYGPAVASAEATNIGGRSSNSSLNFAGGIVFFTFRTGCGAEV